MSSPRTLAFLSRLPAALDEPEQRWAARTISADDEIAFCAAAGRRFQAMTPEREALTARLRKVADEARTARDADPAAIAAEVAELVRPWREEEIDNLRDVLEDCANLLVRSALELTQARLREAEHVGQLLLRPSPAVAQDPHRFCDGPTTLFA